MQIEYTGRQTTVTPRLREQAQMGLQRIERIIGHTGNAHIVLTVEKNRLTAEVTVKARGAELVGAGQSTLMAAALQDALDKAEKQALRHKERNVGRKRNAGISKEDLHVRAVAS
jgi:putative sigma-54 modulation protein